MSKSEAVIQKEILEFSKKHKNVAWMDRANSGKVKVKGGFMQLHEKGTPDLIGYSIDGVFIGLEIKDEPSYNKKDNGLRDDQKVRLKDMKEKGCIVGVACCIEHANDILNG